MPVKRRVAKTRTRSDDLSETAWALLTDRPLPDPAKAGGWELFVLEHSGIGTNAWGPTLQDHWDTHGETITADWAQEHPGTRPSCWWRWTAPRAAAGTCWGRYEVRDAQRFPEPRHPLGGIGAPVYEALNYVPTFEFGLPDRWVTPREVEYYNGRARDVHGNPIGTEYRDGHFPHAAPEPADPPVFESQAAYLKRHGLFLAGEARRLKPADFAPEKIKVDEP